MMQEKSSDKLNEGSNDMTDKTIDSGKSADALSSLGQCKIPSIAEINKDDLAQIYRLLSGNPNYNSCLEDIKKLIPDIAKVNIESKGTGLSFIFEKIDSIASTLTAEDLKIAVYSLGKKIAEISGIWWAASDFTSKLVDCHEQRRDYKTAFEAEEEYCSNKGPLFPSELVFNHYVNLIRLNELLVPSANNTQYIETISKLFTSSNPNPLVSIEALKKLSEYYQDNGDIHKIKTMLSILKAFDDIFVDRNEYIQGEFKDLYAYWEKCRQQASKSPLMNNPAKEPRTDSSINTSKPA